MIEDLIRLQNIDGFLQKNLERFEESFLGHLTEAIERVFKLSKTLKTLEELWNLFYDVQKEYYSGLYPHPFNKKGPVIKQNLQSFLINPLREINFPCSSIKTFEEAARLQNEGIKWVE